MENLKSNELSLTRKIALAALTIAVSFVVLSMFRNTSSILSAIILPIILSFFLSPFTHKEYVFISIIIGFLTLLLITTQTVFMIIYLLQGKFIILLIYNHRIRHKIWYVIYMIVVSISIYAGIIMTEIIFKIPLHAIMMSISNNNMYVYILIIIIEGVVISALHFIVVSKLYKNLIGTRYLPSIYK